MKPLSAVRFPLCKCLSHGLSPISCVLFLSLACYTSHQTSGFAVGRMPCRGRGFKRTRARSHAQTHTHTHTLSLSLFVWLSRAAGCISNSFSSLKESPSRGAVGFLTCQKFLAFYGTRSFISVSGRNWYIEVPWMKKNKVDYFQGMPEMIRFGICLLVP